MNPPSCHGISGFVLPSEYDWDSVCDNMRYAGFAKHLSPMSIEAKGQGQLKGLLP